MKYRRVRVLNGYTAHARFLQEVSATPSGQIPRNQSIPSPYAYSPVHELFRWKDGRQVFIVETKHRRYEVFEVLS